MVRMALDGHFGRATLRAPSRRPGSVQGLEGAIRAMARTTAATPSVATEAPRSRRAAATGQLALELPLGLPEIAVAPEWKSQQRLWGHSLHPMCSYLASFPAALAHAFIARYSRPGDVVLDPFSGRGTTPLQACAEGRIGVGNDLNPFAYLLTASKVDPASPAETRTRLASLRLAWNADSAGWLALADRVIARPGHPASWIPTAGSGRGPQHHDESVP